MSCLYFTHGLHFFDIKGVAKLASTISGLVACREIKTIDWLAKSSHVTIKRAKWNESGPEAVSSSIHKVRGHRTKASKVRPWIECKMDYVKINIINVTSTVHMQDCQKYIGLFNVYPID